MTNFTQTSRINSLAGNQYNAGWEAIDHQIDIIRSEWNELTEGVKDRNIEELRDGVQDLLFTVYGLGHRAGLPVDEDFEKVVASQYEKFDLTSDDAIITKTKYESRGVMVYQERALLEQMNKKAIVIVTYSAEDQLDFKGRYCPKGKWLKSHRFQDPQYAPLPEEVQLKLAL